MNRIPDLRFRENPDRAIFLDGPIDAALAKALTPKIIKLRAESSEPITVYLDSPGGYIHYANNLLELLKSPNQDGQTCRLITVALSHADSAAADFLCQGNYALAYPHSSLHFHGTRVGHSSITREEADALQEHLTRQNEFFATRLAKRVIHRQAFLISAYRSELLEKPSRKRSSGAGKAPSFITKYIVRIADKLSIGNKRILIDSLDELSGLTQIIEFLSSNERNRNRIESKSKKSDRDTTILKLILDFYCREKKELMKGGLTHDVLRLIEADFELHQNWFTKYGIEAERLIREIGPHLLHLELLDEFRSITDEEQKLEFLQRNVSSEVLTLWMFCFTIAKRLQREENELSAIDAYWTGLIDEVVGYDAPNFRKVSEDLPKIKNP
jgi:ATP-dependent protease ClpP protease subunit